jgi:hypothetical protein
MAPQWLEIARVARVVVSSQDREHPIEDAFFAVGNGWRASEPGEQVIRVVFSEPGSDRMQEFVLAWSSRRGETHRQVVRKQFSFSPRGATREVEDYRVELRDATSLELRILPDIVRGAALASLEEFKIA